MRDIPELETEKEAEKRLLKLLRAATRKHDPGGDWTVQTTLTGGRLGGRVLNAHVVSPSRKQVDWKCSVPADPESTKLEIEGERFTTWLKKHRAAKGQTRKRRPPKRQA